MKKVFFFRHPLASPTKPGRWPFMALFEGEDAKEKEGFLYLDGRGPGVLNSNQDPCVLSEPLPWFLAHCRIDLKKKKHNWIEVRERNKKGLLSEVVAPGDWIIFGGPLFPEAEECKTCKEPCGKCYLFVDTVFCVKGTLELPVKKTKDGYYVHCLGTPEGYALFRKAAEKLGLNLPPDLSAFRKSPAWRYNLADTERNHRLVDHAPYRIILAEEKQSFLPTAQEKATNCPFLSERSGLWWQAWEETGLSAAEKIFPALKGGKRRGIAVLSETEGEKLLSFVKESSSLKVSSVKKIFHLSPPQSSFHMTVSEVLRELGYSQREVASWGTIQFLTLNKISRGETPPTLRTLERLARTIGVGMKDLFEEPAGNTRDLFHRIAGCVELEAAVNFETQNACRAVARDLGLKELTEAPRPEPWVGNLADTPVVFVTRSPNWNAISYALARREYPRFSSSWFPGKIEEALFSQIISGKAIFEDKTLRQTLVRLQLLVGAQPEFPSPALTYLRHCAGGNQETLEVCAEKFFNEILDKTQDTVIILPEAASEAEKFLPSSWIVISKGEDFELRAQPAGDEAPLLETEIPPKQNDWQKIIFGSRLKPKLLLILKKDKVSHKLSKPLRFHLRGNAIATFKLLSLFASQEIGESLFEKIQACPEIRRYVRGERINLCKEVFRSYKAVRLEDIFRPLPWAGKLDKAPILFVGFKPPLKKDDYPRYGNTSLEEVRHLFEKAIEGQESPFPLVREILAEFLNLERSATGLGKYCAYTPIVNCRNTINEGQFPAEIFRTCCRRYLCCKLAISPAKLVIVLGRKASQAVQEILNLQADPAKASLYYCEILEKTFVFLPSVKKRLNEQLSEKDLALLAPLRDDLLKKILLELLNESKRNKVAKKRRIF